MKNPKEITTHGFGRSLTFTLLMLLFSTGGFSQIASLSTSHVILSPDTNLAVGDTVVMTYTVKNTGSTAYTGYLNINFSTDPNGFSLAGMCTVPSVTLNPNSVDSMNGTCTITIDSTYFQPGFNIVVVWSSGNARTAADTVWSHVNVNGSTAGIHENDPSAAFSFYPTVVKDLINVENSGTTMPLKIFVEDASGRIINVVYPSPESRSLIKINTSELSGGIYFLDILMPDRIRVVSKFLKAE